MALCNSEFIICFIYSQGGFDEEIYMHAVVNVEQYTVHLHIITVRILLLWNFNGQCNLRSLLYVNIHCWFHDVSLQTICMKQAAAQFPKFSYQEPVEHVLSSQAGKVTRLSFVYCKAISTVPDVQSEP